MAWGVFRAELCSVEFVWREMTEIYFFDRWTCLVEVMMNCIDSNRFPPTFLSTAYVIMVHHVSDGPIWKIAREGGRGKSSTGSHDCDLTAWEPTTTARLRRRHFFPPIVRTCTLARPSVRSFVYLSLIQWNYKLPMFGYYIDKIHGESLFGKRRTTTSATFDMTTSTSVDPEIAEINLSEQMVLSTFCHYPSIYHSGTEFIPRWLIITAPSPAPSPSVEPQWIRNLVQWHKWTWCLLLGSRVHYLQLLMFSNFIDTFVLTSSHYITHTNPEAGLQTFILASRTRWLVRWLGLIGGLIHTNAYVHT